MGILARELMYYAEHACKEYWNDKNYLGFKDTTQFQKYFKSIVSWKIELRP